MKKLGLRVWHDLLKVTRLIRGWSGYDPTPPEALFQGCLYFRMCTVIDTHSYTHVCIHTDTHTGVHGLTHVHSTQSHACLYRYPRTLVHAHTHTRSSIHTSYSNTCTPTHMHLAVCPHLSFHFLWKAGFTLLKSEYFRSAILQTQSESFLPYSLSSSIPPFCFLYHLSSSFCYSLPAFIFWPWILEELMKTIGLRLKTWKKNF